MELLSVKQAAEVLGITPQMVRIHLRRGSLPATHVGQTWAILREDLDKFAKIPRRPGRKARTAS